MGVTKRSDTAAWGRGIHLKSHLHLKHYLVQLVDSLLTADVGFVISKHLKPGGGDRKELRNVFLLPGFTLSSADGRRHLDFTCRGSSACGSGL